MASSLYNICLEVVIEKMEEIQHLYHAKHIDFHEISQAMPPTICEQLISSMEGVLDARLLKKFMRPGIKNIELRFYENHLPKEELNSCCQTLTFLDIAWSRLEEQELIMLISQASNVVCLNLSGINFSDHILELIGHTCNHIEKLVLQFCRMITDNGLILLCHHPQDKNRKRCQKLKVLNVLYTKVSEKALVLLLEQLPLIILRLETRKKVKVTELYTQRNFNRPSEARQIAIHNRFDIVDILSCFPHVRHLVINRTTLSNEDIINLTHLHSLKCLSLTNRHNSENQNVVLNEGLTTFLRYKGKSLKELRLKNFSYINLYIIGKYCENITDLKLFKISHLHYRVENSYLRSKKVKLFKKLTSFVLSKPVNDPWEDCLEKFFKCCNELQRCEMKNVQTLTDDTVIETLPYMTNLKRIIIYRCNNITVRTIFALLERPTPPSFINIWLMTGLLSHEELVSCKTYAMINTPQVFLNITFINNRRLYLDDLSHDMDALIDDIPEI